MIMIIIYLSAVVFCHVLSPVLH